jgi:acetyltransferase-like isoleucine patch superfamily enzyme
VTPIRGRITPSWLVSHSRASVERANLLVFNALQSLPVIPLLLRWALLRAWGVKAATRRISHGCWFGGRDIHIGPDTFVNFGCVFDNLGSIRVGAGCHFGMRAMLVTSTHEIGPASSRAGRLEGKPITVGDGCWIGAGAIVLPGVTVGTGCIVASGAVVTRECEPHGVYAGNPARRLRDLE